MLEFSPLPVGTVLESRYELVADCQSNKTSNQHLLGSGGFGAVYLAHDLSLKREVAIKQSILLKEKNSLVMFRREAQLLANLSHPALPKVLHFFSDEESCFIVMDLIKGDDLEERVNQSGNLPFAEVRDIALQLFEVLDYLHGHSIIHKDIKPANLKYTGGQLKLLDFGLAKGSVGLMSEHKETIVRGLTPAWAPPEQLNAKPTTNQSDLYSATATIYFLASGLIPPNAHKRAIDIAIYQIETLGRLDKMNHIQVPEWFAEVINEGLSLSMEKRPSSAAIMRERLETPVWVETGLVLQDDPEAVRYFKHGNNCYNQRAFIEAINNYNKAIEVHPNFAEAYHKRAGAYFHKNNFYLGLFTLNNDRETRINLSRAIQDSTRAIEVQAHFVEAYTQRALIYFFKQNFKHCIRDCNNAIELNADYAEAYGMRGRAFWVLAENHRLKRASYLARALSDCNKAIELQPTLAQAYAIRGNVYSRRGEHNQAVNDCTRSIKLSSPVDSPRYFLGRGVAYLKRGTFEQAISDCSKAIELQGDLLLAYYWRAKAYSKVGAKTKARHDRRKAAEFTMLRKKAWAARIIFWIYLALNYRLVVVRASAWQIGAGLTGATLLTLLMRQSQQLSTSMVLLTTLLSLGGLMLVYLWVLLS